MDFSLAPCLSTCRRASQGAPTVDRISRINRTADPMRPVKRIARTDLSQRRRGKSEANDLPEGRYVTPTGATPVLMLKYRRVVSISLPVFWRAQRTIRFLARKTKSRVKKGKEKRERKKKKKIVPIVKSQGNIPNHQSSFDRRYGFSSRILFHTNRRLYAHPADVFFYGRRDRPTEIDLIPRNCNCREIKEKNKERRGGGRYKTGTSAANVNTLSPLRRAPIENSLSLRFFPSFPLPSPLEKR